MCVICVGYVYVACVGFVKSQHEKCNFKEQPMTAQLKINIAMPQAARHENRESAEIRLESRANL